MENNEILKHFETLPDHRQNGKILHPMRNIVFIVLVGAFNRLDGWEEIADFAEYRREFFEKYLDLTNGIPSDDTLRRFFEALDSKAFRTHFSEWASSIVPKTEDKTVCIDGKRIRTASRMSDDPIHIVSAWVAENQLTLAQTMVSDKSKEITAIPQLIEILDLKGATVTIDAIGCQTGIARKIRKAGADYILGVKDNQPSLMEEVEDTVRTVSPDRVITTTDIGHGRIEERKYMMYSDLSSVLSKDRWPDLGQVVRVETRQIVKKTGAESSDTRYFITSHKLDSAEKVAECVRKHWGIESMHWQLDVIFDEDSCLKRMRNSAENFDIVRKIVMGVLRNDGVDYGKKRVSLKRRMLRAIHDEGYLHSLLRRL